MYRIAGPEFTATEWEDGSGDLSSALHAPEKEGDLSVRGSLSGVITQASMLVVASPT